MKFSKNYFFDLDLKKYVNPFSEKKYIGVIFGVTMQGGLSGYFGHLPRQDPREDTSPHLRGGVMGGVYREGYNKKPPTKDRGW
jgi:hypothetical protein